MLNLCECEHALSYHNFDGNCQVCGCPNYVNRHDARYDPDDVADQGYGGEVNGEQLNYWRDGR